MSKVSVIIPVYNVEKYLRECLDSVINQTLKDIEIICVNDGSTDNSLQILEEYAQKDERIKIIAQENKGQAVARNVGIKIAQGEFIGFLDSDDYLDLNFYENLYNRAKETNSNIVVCEYMYRFKDSNKGKKIFLKVDKNIVSSNIKEKFECLYLPYYCYVPNKIYQRDCIKDDFLEGLKWEDIYFTTNILAKNNRLAVAKDIAYYYRNNPCSTVNEKSNLNNYYCHKAHAYFFDFVYKHNICVDTNKYYSTKKYKLLGLTVLKVSRNFFKTRYSLLGLINWSKF